MPEEVEDAAPGTDRWRVWNGGRSAGCIDHPLAGSHDLAITWLAGHFEIVLVASGGFMGSMGLDALAENR
jgi:hypothetical protein